MDKESCLTIAAKSVAEIVEKKSRFIAIAMPICSEDEAKSFLQNIKTEYSNARHYVYAWAIGGASPSYRCSDDGEPAGTAGKPVLDIIKSAGLSDMIIVVVRYFGGTLLGSGGLVRAYSKSTQLAIEQCQIVKKHPAHQFSLSFAYPSIKLIDSLLAALDIQVSDKVFAQEVCYICMIDDGIIYKMKSKLLELNRNDIRLDELGISGYTFKSI